jgi:hypothetical protein
MVVGYKKECLMDVINAPVGETSIASLKSEAPTSIILAMPRTACLTSRTALVRDPYAGWCGRGGQRWPSLSR